jgi:hypothetical protein
MMVAGTWDSIAELPRSLRARFPRPKDLGCSATPVHGERRFAPDYGAQSFP